nr:hypothetical protein [Lysinibacillus timonensis]
MLTVRNVESFLKNLISENSKDIKNVWETFKAFCKDPVDGEEDKEILVQCGVSAFSGEELFYFDLVRQFTLNDGENHTHMEQLHCECLFEPTDELKKLEVSEWSMDYDNIDDFFGHIENLEEFKIVLNFKPIKLDIYQEEV